MFDSLLYPKLADLQYELELIQNDLDTLQKLKSAYDFRTLTIVPLHTVGEAKYFEISVAPLATKEKLHTSAILPSLIAYDSIANRYRIATDKLVFLIEEVDLSKEGIYTGNGALLSFSEPIELDVKTIADFYLNSMLAQLKLFNLYLVPIVLIRQLWVPTKQITYEERKRIEELLHTKFVNFYADYKTEDKIAFRLNHTYFTPPNTVIVLNPEVKLPLFVNNKGQFIVDFTARDFLFADDIENAWNFTEIQLQMSWPKLTAKEALLLQKVDIEYQFSFAYLLLNADTNEGIGILLQVLDKFIFKPVKFYTYTALEETTEYLIKQYATGIYSGVYTDTYNVNTYQPAIDPTVFIRRHIYLEYTLRRLQVVLDFASIFNYLLHRLDYGDSIIVDEVEDNKAREPEGLSAAYICNPYFQMQFNAPYYLTLAEFELSADSLDKMLPTDNLWTRYIVNTNFASDALNRRIKTAELMNRVLKAL